LLGIGAGLFDAYKKIISYVLVIAVLLSMNVTVYATDFVEGGRKPSEFSTRMTYIGNVYTSLSISSKGKSNSYASMNAYSEVDKVRISMYLQQYDSGWKTVKNWAQDFTGTYGSLSKDWYVKRGHDYRVLTYFYAYDGSKSESYSRTHKVSYS